MLVLPIGQVKLSAAAGAQQIAIKRKKAIMPIPDILDIFPSPGLQIYLL